NQFSDFSISEISEWIDSADPDRSCLSNRGANLKLKVEKYATNRLSFSVNSELDQDCTIELRGAPRKKRLQGNSVGSLLLYQFPHSTGDNREKVRYAAPPNGGGRLFFQAGATC